MSAAGKFGSMFFESLTQGLGLGVGIAVTFNTVTDYRENSRKEKVETPSKSGQKGELKTDK